VASDVTQTGAVPGAAPAPAPAAPKQREPLLGTGVHRKRFIIVYAVLAAALGAAIAGVAIYAGQSITAPPAWSSWQPSGGGQGAAKQIAAHVSSRYRLPDGNQLVDVFSKAPSVSPSSNATVPIHYVVVRGGRSAANEEAEVTSTNSVMFSLCGLGQACSIASGKPSVQRGTLVRREILELALYTFKYVPGIEHVIAFMPPQPGQQPKYVVYLREADLKDRLDVPLSQTLGPKVPLPLKIPASEVRTIDATTEPRVYSFNVSVTQNGDAVFVFDPLPA
jgi:hypothetical protein